MNAPVMVPIDDGYLPLKALARYSGLSVRTLRRYLTDASRPLPSYRIGGKVLVRRAEFDAWAKQFRVSPAVVNVERLADQLLERLG
jgi:excisionase family DNA binding protein